MQKTSTELKRVALNGPTMGTRWSALLHLPPWFDAAELQRALAQAVAQVDAQMSTWKPDSDLTRLNNADKGVWVDLPDDLLLVLEASIAIGRASDGAFEIGVGDAIGAWGFGHQSADPKSIERARLASRRPAYDCLEIDRKAGRARKHASISLDLNGIAKGYGVDRLAGAARAFGLDAGLFAIDGELRALGAQPDGRAWFIAVERPDYNRRAPHSMIELVDAAVATSGDYRHWVEIDGKRLSHTIDPRKGMPLVQSPASVTVIAKDCMSADAWATAMMVLGEEGGMLLAKSLGLSVLFLYRDSDHRAGCGVFEC